MACHEKKVRKFPWYNQHDFIKNLQTIKQTHGNNLQVKISILFNNFEETKTVTNVCTLL